MDDPSYGDPYGRTTQQTSTMQTIDQDNKNEALLARRNASVVVLWKHTMVSAGLSLFGVAVGIGNIVVGADSDDGRWHLSGGSLVPAILIGKEKNCEQDIGTTAKCLFISHYTMNWIVLHAGLAFFALSIVGILWCSGAVTTYTTTNKKTRITTSHNTTCPNDETAAIATASLAVVDCVAITVCSIVGLVLYHLYFRYYGIKARGEY
ncbi:uncharacterized protein [Magallana gigas]|uniref:uncharacterized protein isoform X3 n=1 Tax=Magallana gigas TaxID=29159 RepID=UPI00333E943D